MRPALTLAAGLAVVAMAGCATANPVTGVTPDAPGSASGASAPVGPSAAPTASEPIPAASESTPAAPATPTEQPATEPAAGSCAALAASLSLEEQAGQLVMTGTQIDLSSSVASAIKRKHLGSVILMGKSTRSVNATRATTDSIHALNPTIPPLVAVDQEGGLVQRLQGPGFDAIPDARAQAKLSDADLTAAAQRWGLQLHDAGVDLTFAPVADVVPADKVSTNAPIGRLRRGYGSTGDQVAAKVGAFVRGMQASGVGTSPKHFPNLGEVTENTDFAHGVTDTVTDGKGDELKPYRAAIDAGTDTIMVSTAIYTKIDPQNPGAFSSKVVGIIRNDLGFDGVVVTDDLGVAKAVAKVPAAQRAVRAVAAGADIAITVDPALASAMADGLVQAAKKDAAVAGQVTKSAERVLVLKARHGLVKCEAVKG